MPTDHKGTHSPHWDRENPDGTHTSVYPDSQPNNDMSFREKIGAIMGLSGTALTIYIIISEASRFFPPRNLILVP